MSAPEACRDTRSEIYTITRWIAGLETIPALEDKDREAFETEADVALQGIQNAYTERPVGCAMQVTGDYDEFRCHCCDFWCHVTID